MSDRHASQPLDRRFAPEHGDSGLPIGGWELSVDRVYDQGMEEWDTLLVNMEAV